MSGLPRKKPGVWQSLQPASTTRYLPRSICESACARGNSANAAPAAARPTTAMVAKARMAYLPSVTFIVVHDAGRVTALRHPCIAEVIREERDGKRMLRRLCPPSCAGVAHAHAVG